LTEQLRMKDKAFIDTNIIIYLYSEDEPEKQRISKKTFDNYECIVSTQVLNEFCNICFKKFNLSSDEVQYAINEIISQCNVLLIETENISQALDIHAKYGYGYFDSLIISSALSSNCKYLLTEDLTDGQIINDKLTIINILKSNSHQFSDN